MSKLKISISILFILIFFTGFSQSKKIETGIASYYHDCFKGRRTANGEKYSPVEMTAAHLSLPFNTRVLVRNLINNKSIVVRINDRGPFVNNRIIDLSKAAADSLDFIKAGLVKVEVIVLPFEEFIDSIAKPFIAKVFNKKSEKPTNLISSSTINSKKTKIDSVKITNRTTSVNNTVVYGIQIGSFKTRANMLNLSEKLRDNYIEKFNVQEVDKGGELFYRMILGEFSDIKEAEKLRAKIKKEFPGCFVIQYH